MSNYYRDEKYFIETTTVAKQISKSYKDVNTLHFWLEDRCGNKHSKVVSVDGVVSCYAGNDGTLMIEYFLAEPIILTKNTRGKDNLNYILKVEDDILLRGEVHANFKFGDMLKLHGNGNIHKI